MDTLASLFFFILFMLCGYFFGSMAEKKHYRSIRLREAQYQKIVVLAKRFPEVSNVKQTLLVTGSVVVSVDYFKKFLAALKMLLGGSLTSYESLLDRARREAILRMQQQAAKRQAKLIYNVRFETSSISKGQKDAVGSIEVLVYGTALVIDEDG